MPCFDHADAGELLDVIESLLAFNRVPTFDEVDGEREVIDRARGVVGRYRQAI